MANATSNANTAVGVNTLGYTTGDYNTAVGSSALSQASTATLNTAIGISAGNSTFVSSNNTFVGAHTDLSSDTWTNSAALGYGAIITASNQVQLGNTSTTNVVSSGVVSGPLVNGSGFITPNNGNGAYVGWNRSGGVAETNFVTNTPYGSGGLGQGGWEFVTRTSDGVYGRQMYIDGANGNVSLTGRVSGVFLNDTQSFGTALGTGIVPVFVVTCRSNGAGYISFTTTGTGLATNTSCFTNTYAFPYTLPPCITFSPANAQATAQIQYMYVDSQPTYWRLMIQGVTLNASQNYKFFFQILSRD
jgi:hypothetical protein